ncbi:sulfurtransferase TusA family protein [Caulobacter henricii]|uniref:sulfurtransferase TusA family protein n=1 Tax=Caulobacter henricii TaxID=69395 RepID=UPI000A03B17D|nr:sulfurtransferase TusA family protein [Caulobacter henricii]
MASPTLVDARGHRCPVPTLRLRRALESAPPGGQILLIADDPMARIDVPHFASSAGATVDSITDGDSGSISFLVTKKAP